MCVPCGVTDLVLVLLSAASFVIHLQDHLLQLLLRASHQLGGLLSLPARHTIHTSGPLIYSVYSTRLHSHTHIFIDHNIHIPHLCYQMHDISETEVREGNGVLVRPR